MLPYWPQLLLFMSAVMLLALYGLTASGHFPAEVRSQALKGGSGAAALWGSATIAGIAAGLTLLRGWDTLPWHAAVIGAGAMLLFAPLLLRPLPDSFVNGRLGLLAFSAGAAVPALLLWRPWP
ncbi:MAG: hypothetical protein K2X43_14685 [Hyphomonadaceae bacterium]|nr:hypothetical protein [Hyphomonadaceae bacterium]